MGYITRKWPYSYWKVFKGRLNVVEKIKNIFSIIGAVLSIALFTFLLFLLRRRDSDGCGSTGTGELDTRITEGLERASEEIRGTAERCEERLRRAEEILRRATERSKER